MHAIAVALTRPDVGQIAMKNERGRLRQIRARLAAFGIKETKVDALRHLRKNGEIRPDAIPRRTEGIRFARPDPHELVRIYK
jgi:hypothetical protein